MGLGFLSKKNDCAVGGSSVEHHLGVKYYNPLSLILKPVALWAERP